MPKRNEPGKKSMKHLKKIQQKRETDMKKKKSPIYQTIRIKKEEKRKRTIVEEERLNKVAFELAKKFPYSKLTAAIDGKGGYEVHGFMEQTYIDYDWLIDNYVLDRACFYAKRDYIPEFIKFIKEIDIKDYKRSVIETSQEIYFENYTQFPFNKIIVYSKEPLDDAVTWIDDYPWELDGYDTFVTLGPCNLALLGWATWNIPIVLILHAPGKNKALHKARISAKDLKDEKTEQLKNFIYQYKTYANVMEEKIDELELESLQYQKLYSDLKRTTLVGSPLTTADEFAKFEKRRQKGKSTSLRKINWKSITWGIVAIVVIAFLIILMMQLLGGSGNIPANSTSSIIKSTKIMMLGRLS